MDRLRERADVVPHLKKRWRDLSENEANAIAREVGHVAREALQSPFWNGVVKPLH
jgi:hypothetical protein